MAAASRALVLGAAPRQSAPQPTEPGGRFASPASGSPHRRVAAGPRRRGPVVLGDEQVDGGHEAEGDAAPVVVPATSSRPMRDGYGPGRPALRAAAARASAFTSAASITGPGQPCRATSIMAIPIRSVVVTRSGKNRSSTGRSGPTTE